MKQDKLEKFVKDHREEFDVFEPDDKMWDRISKPSPKILKINWKTIAVRVAAIVVVFIGSYFFHDYVQMSKGDEVVVVQQPNNIDGLENIKVLMEAEVFYTSQINSAKEEIIQLSGNDENLMRIINYDLVELDEAFEDLKNDLKDDSDNEEVIEAMMQNYRIKFEILEEMLYQLRKSKNKKENKNQDYEI